MADKKINIGLGFNVDKTNLNTLKTELQSLLNMTTDDLIKIGSENAVADLKEIQTAASAVQSALEKSFNPKLNTQDLTKFQQELKMSGQSISSIKASLDKAGVSGQNAFRNITTELLTTNRQLKQSSQWLDKMADTMANTVRWTVASSALNAVTGSVQKAYGFTKQLDTSLNDIRIVTGKSADEMARFAKEATTAAKNLGSTTTAYTKAALIYEQQGLGEVDVAARTDVTTKVSNVTGQSAADVSEQLTAIWNGYKVSAAEAELYIDKVSAVAATTAADLEELSEGMGKVASAANSMGVDIDQLNASLATIISVTRQDASAVGTSLKTIYARMGDLAVDGEDEFGVKLGDVSSKLKTMGIDILDTQGQMREMGEVIEEVAAKWDTWTRAQQQAAAVALAGKRQYNNLIALFENWDMYEEAKSTSQGGAGELQKQQDIYMESMEAHLNQLQAEAEELYQTLLDPEGLNPLIDALTSIVGLAENLIESLGGGAGLLTTLGSIGLNVFSNQITKGITTTIHNITGFKDNLKQAAAEAALINELQITNPEDERQQKILDIAKQRLGIMKSMSEEEYRLTNDTLKQTNELYKQKDALDAKQAELVDIVKTHTNIKLELDKETGAIKNSTEAIAALQSQLTNGFADSKDTGMKAITGIEELVSLTEDVERKQKSVSSRKGKVTQFSNQQKDAAQEHTIAISADMITAEEQEMAALAQDRLRESTDKLEKAQSDLARSQDYLKQSQDAVSAASNNSAESIAALLDQIEKELHNEDYSIDQKKELLEIQRALTNAFDKDGKIHTKNSDVVKAAADAVKKYNITIKKQEGSVKSAVKELDTFNNKLKENKQRTEEAETKLKELKKSFDLTKAVQNITSLVGGVANLGNGIKTLAGLGDIWSNEDLTAGERLLQTFTSLSFAIPQIVTPIKDGIKWFKTFSNEQKITALTTLSNAAATKLLEEAKENLTEEEYKNIAAQLAQGGALNKNNAATLLNAGSQGVLKTSIDLATKSILAQTAALLANPTTWIVLGIAAAVTALTVAVVAGVKAWNADAEAAKKATETSKALGDEYKQTKAAYEELKQSIADYRDAQTAIDELTVGTEEWRDAIQDVNDKVLELIQNYPILAKYMSNENGRLVISDEGLEVAQQQKREAVNTAFQKSVIAQQVANDAQLKSDATNLGKKSSYASADSLLKGNVMFGTLGVLGYVVNSAITRDWNPYDEATSSKEIEDVASRAQLADNADMWTSYEEFANALDGYSKSQIDALWENSEELKALCEEIHANTEVNKNLDTAIIQSAMSDNQDYQDSEFQEGINQVLSALKNEAIDKYRDKYDDMGNKAVMQEYANRMIASGEWKAEDVQVKKDRIIVGDTEKFVKQQDTIRDLLAQQDAIKDVENTNIKKLDASITNLTKNISGTFGKTLTGGAITSSNIGEATSKDLTQALQQLNADLTPFENDIKILGYQTIEDYKAALSQAINDYQTTSENIQNSLISGLASLLYDENGAFFIDGLKLDEQRIISEQMNTIAEEYGFETINQIKTIFTELGDEASNVAVMMSKVNTSDTLYSFIQQINEKQELIEKFGEGQLDWLANILKDSLNLYENASMEAFNSTLVNLRKVAEAITDMGDLIAPEKWAELPTELKDYFTKTVTGDYALNISGAEFNRKVREYNINERQRLLDDIDEEVKDIENNYKTAIEDKQRAARNFYLQKDSDTYFAKETYNDINRYSPQYTSENGTVIRGVTSNDDASRLAEDYNKTFVRRYLVDKDVVDQMWKYITTYSYKDQLDQWLSFYGTSIADFQVGAQTDDHGRVWMRNNDLAAVNRIYELVHQQAMEGTLYSQAMSNIMQDYGAAETQIKEFGPDSEKYISTVAKQKEQYQKATSTASYQELLQWRDLGYITQQDVDKELYRFQVDVDFGLDAFADLNREFDKTSKKVSKLQEQSEELFGESLKQNLIEQNIELNTGRGILISSIDQVKTKALRDSDYIDYFNNLVSSDEGGLGLSKINSNFKLDIDPNTGRINNLVELETIFEQYYGSEEEAKAMFQDFVTKALEHNKWSDQLETFNEQLEEQNELLKENALAIFDHQFKTAHEINDIKKSYNNFIKEFSLEDDDYFSQGENAADNYALAFDDVEKSMTKIAGLSSVKYDNDKKMYEINGEMFTQEELRVAILEEGASLQEYALSLKESLTNLQELEMAQLEEIAEQYDNIVGYAESWNEFLEHGLTLQELIHGENYEATKSWYEAQTATVQSQLQTQKSEYAYWKNIVAEIEAGTRSDYTYDEARAKMLESGKEVAATSAELGQMLYDNFERAWNSHFEGFERAKSEYEWISSQAERTFDALTGALESQKLINDWTKTMNETLDADAQKRMKEFIDLQEEKLRNLRTEGKLSQYNLDLAQAEFDLLQAQMALEDARNNKTQMRLTRGADGSYSYQYVADDQAIVQAESQVSEAAKNRLDIVKKEMDSQVNNFYDDVADLQNLLLEYTPDGISPEEEAELNKRVAAMRSNLFDANGNVRLEADLREAVESAAAAAGIEGYENLSLEELVEKFPEFKGYLDIINAIKEGKLETILENGISSVGDLMDYFDSLVTTVGGSPSGEDGTLMGEIKDLLAGLTADEQANLEESIDGLEKISKAAELAKKSFDDFAGSIIDVIDNLKILGTTTDSEEWQKNFKDIYISTLPSELQDQLNGIGSAVTESVNSSLSQLTSNFNANIGKVFTDALATNAAFARNEIGSVHISFPKVVDKEGVIKALDDFFNSTEQFISTGGGAVRDLSPIVAVTK